MLNIIMRKFVVKNRQKRKYVKKNEKESLYSFSKTTYGILPILIMAVAFMATITISAPFRNFFVNFRINLQLPQIALSNPLPFFQSVYFDLIQSYLISTQVITAIVTSLFHTFDSATTAAKQGLAIFNPQPLFALLTNSFVVLGNSLWNATLFISKNLLLAGRTTIHFFLFMLSFTLSNANFASILIVHILFFIGQCIISSATIALQFVFKFAIAASQFITNVSVFIFQILLQIITILFTIIASVTVSLWVWLYSVIVATTQAINTAFTNTLHVIEIPFKILEAFGLAMKPYVDMLDHHMLLSGEDFTKGFSNIGKIIAFMSSSK